MLIIFCHLLPIQNLSETYFFLLKNCNKIVFLLSTPSYEEKENDPKRKVFMTNKWSVSYNGTVVYFHLAKLSFLS